MSEQTFDQQAITQYLLGALPDTEAERLDELSVSDEEFAAALSAAEKDLIDAYVQGELSGAALEQFKSHYLASSLRREKVKFAQAFQLFADQNSGAPVAGIEAESAASAATQRKSSGWFSGLGVFRAPRFALGWGLAVATLALLVAGTWLVFENMRLRQQRSQTQASREVLLQREQELQKQIEGARLTNSAAEQELARLRSERERLEQELAKRKTSGDSNSPGAGRIVSFVLAPPLRGAGQIPTMAIPAGTSLVSMQLQLEPNANVAYRVTLVNQSHKQTLWRSGKLKAKTTGEGQALNLSFDAGLLNSPAVYVLQVSGIKTDGAAEVIGDYSFRVGK